MASRGWKGLKLIVPSTCGFHHVSAPLYVSQIHG